jgi:hypothetical protein
MKSPPFSWGQALEKSVKFLGVAIMMPAHEGWVCEAVSSLELRVGRTTLGCSVHSTAEGVHSKEYTQWMHGTEHCFRVLDTQADDIQGVCPYLKWSPCIDKIVLVQGPCLVPTGPS